MKCTTWIFFLALISLATWSPARADDDSPPETPATGVSSSDISTAGNTPAVPANTVYIPVGSARTKKTVIAFPNIVSEKPVEKAIASTIYSTVSNDLNFMDLFNFLNSNAFIEDASKTGITLGSFKFSDWKGIGADFLIKTSVTLDSAKQLTFEAHLYDTSAGKQVFAKKYLASSGEAKLMGHSFANDVVKTLTGMPGIFLTKMAMSCDLTGKKEIYTSNFDGSDVRQVTHHRSISFAPAWSPDSTRIAYSVFTRHSGNIKNIDLYEFNFTTNMIRMLSNRRGINSGAAYSPDGKTLAATLSFQGNPEIFSLDLSTLGMPGISSTVTRLTRSFGFDVDPSWSPDGKSLAFVSSRTGMPMVFGMDADGKNIRRLTYAGRYNATPSWSPQNNKIAFAGWIDQSFDIFIMNPDGTHIERLTKNQGNNEDPFFSPDGNFVVFSSNRTGQKNVYVMNVDGTFVKRLSYGLGNCVSPKWSNPPIPKVSEVQH